MIILYIWFYSLLISPLIIMIYQIRKNKYMSWQSFAWWMYGIFIGVFPFYVVVVEHMKL